MLVKRAETFFPILLPRIERTESPNRSHSPSKFQIFENEFVKKLNLKLIINRSIDLRLSITNNNPIDNPSSPMYKLSFRNFVTTKRKNIHLDTTRVRSQRE